MSRKIPKLALRQGIRERTPPPLIQWDLNELERERWETLSSHQKVFTKREKAQKLEEDPHSTIPPRSNLKSSHIKPQKFSEFSRIPHEKEKSKNTNHSPKPMSQLLHEPQRPLTMPRLGVSDASDLPQGKSLLEKAERSTASEPIDQNSLRFQVKLRRNVELIHEEDLKAREEQWREKIAKTRDTLEKLKKRNTELEEVTKKYQVKKGAESEASKEISRLIEYKAKLSDDINHMIARKTDLEKHINELHSDYEKTSLNFEGQQRHLNEELAELKRQITMSENEKLDTVMFNKENLTKKKKELLVLKQQLIDRWHDENKDFNVIFKETEDKKNEIKLQISSLKDEKELLQQEKKLLESKQAEFDQEKEVVENNKRTLELFHSFQDPKLIANTNLIKEIVQNAAKNIMNKDAGYEDTIPQNEFAEFLSQLKAINTRRYEELQKNYNSQITNIDEQLKKSKSVSNLSSLRRQLQK